MAAQDHQQRQQTADERHGGAGQKPETCRVHVKSGELCRDQVDEEHQPDRGTARKGKPATELRGAEDRHGEEVGEWHLRDPAIEILLLHFRQVLLVLSERADEEQEDAGEKHHHRDLE